MPSEREQLIAVRILNVYPYSEGQQGVGVPQNFLVVLKGEENRVVPINIGPFEGQALVMALRHIPLPRPLPHHLLQNLLEKMKTRVHKLVIHSLKEEVFHAYLLIQSQEEAFCLDCRPSDGMIVATLMGVPIFLSPQVMTDAGKLLEVDQSEEEQEEEDGEDKECAGDRPAIAGKAVAIEPSAAAEAVEPPASELERLEARLNRLIVEEAYEEAARVRDQISRLRGDPS
ncbi:MAG: bifunctional nuclease family protein [Candidatus Latescibacterota bacterium]|jgi:hypothetical protein